MNKIEELRYLIKAVDKEGENQYRKMLAPLDITPNQNEVLKILAKTKGLAISEIGELLICGSDSPSRVIQRLQLKKLVEKTSDPVDSRRSVIQITTNGQRVLKQALEIEQHFNEIIQSNVESYLEVDQLIQMLKKQIAGSKTSKQIENRKELDS